MAAPEVTLVDPRVYKYEDRLEVPAGENQIIINLPATIPAGKKARVRIDIRAILVDA